MAEQLIITAKDKAGIYAEILPQIEAVVSAETDMIANMANVVAALKQTFNFFWVGFYIVALFGQGATDNIILSYIYESEFLKTLYENNLVVTVISYFL